MSQRGSEAGVAMLTMMLLVVVLTGLWATAATRTQVVARSTVLERGKLLTFHAAAGGLSRARHALGRNRSYGGEALHVGNCRVSIQVKPMPATATGMRCWRVVVLASHQTFGEVARPIQHRIEVDLRATSGLPDVLAFREGGG